MDFALRICAEPSYIKRKSQNRSWKRILNMEPPPLPQSRFESEIRSEAGKQFGKKIIV